MTPCVLPLVPGYLAAVSGSQPGVAGRKVVIASLPFVAGLHGRLRRPRHASFAGAGGLIGRSAPRQADRRNRDRRPRARVHGAVCRFRTSTALLLPGCSSEARGTGSRVLLGGAFAVCAAPCVGPVLASILALASNSTTAWKGAILLAVYSLGLAVPFLLVGLGFGRVIERLALAPRPLRHRAGRQRRRFSWRSGSCSSSTVTGGSTPGSAMSATSWVLG